MARPRTVPAEDSLRRLDGAPPPEGNYTRRRAKAALRGQARKEAAMEPRLAPEELAARLAPTQRVLDTVTAIGEGRYKGRNAREVIAAARLLLDFHVSKPAVEVNARVASITIVDPYAAPLGTPIVEAAK